MESNRITELKKLTQQYFVMASSHVNQSKDLNEQLIKAIKTFASTEDSEIPAFENKTMKFGKFENREFVVMMTDIRDSTSIINGKDGLVDMFMVFYIYAGIVAKIVDLWEGTSTEFLGDGVLNLFDTKDGGREKALRQTIGASWDIMDAREQILNPFFTQVGLPNINLGIGIDHGITIVTRFGYRGDTDLKAFGRCAYNAAKLSKGFNEIHATLTTQSVWPVNPGGKVQFGSIKLMDGLYCYPISRLP